jgi:hypothetical protein
MAEEATNDDSCFEQSYGAAGDPIRRPFSLSPRINNDER